MAPGAWQLASALIFLLLTVATSGYIICVLWGELAVGGSRDRTVTLMDSGWIRRAIDVTVRKRRTCHMPPTHRLHICLMHRASHQSSTVLGENREACPDNCDLPAAAAWAA